jgi:hypothetical protein
VADYIKHLRKPVAKALGPGEEVLAGTPCLPRGAITQRAAGALFGAVGVAVAGQAARSGHVYEGQELPSIVALALTAKRVLIFRKNPVTGRPSKVLYDIPLTQIAGVRSSQGRAVGFKMLKLDVVFVNESSLELDVASEHMRHGKRFVEALADATTSMGDISEQ